jgi:hypothetical protein
MRIATEKIEKSAPPTIARGIDLAHLDMIGEKESNGFDEIRKNRKRESEINDPNVERLRENGTADDDLPTAPDKNKVMANRGKGKKRRTTSSKKK